jgi:hypothetical protein
MIVNNELEGICKKPIVTQFKVLPRYFPGGTEENHSKIFGVPGESRTDHLPNIKKNILPPKPSYTVTQE